MKKQSFNDNWYVYTGIANPFGAIFGADPLQNAKKITLPYDAMIYEKTDENEPNGTTSGFYPSKTYTFTKFFEAPENWNNEQVILEFEGVMSKAKVYLNNNLIATNDYGYGQFYINLTPHLKYGEENTLQVTAININNSSRWYSGSGIYRNVNLWLGNEISLLPEKTRITTPDVTEDEASIIIDSQLNNVTKSSNNLKITTNIINNNDQIVANEEQTATIPAQSTITAHFRFNLDNPALWSPDSPNLYYCQIVLKQNDQEIDKIEIPFGIRKLQLDAKYGLRINGKVTNLRGACIHHDNGIIGAATLADAEEFRCQKLKDAGFNAIRSSHHPMRKEMLTACDKIGMLVMDELSDMWNNPKHENDISFEFSESWSDQITKMVAKDFNHPSVILYSLGNEIPEIGQESGRVQLRKLAEKFHKEDSTRFTTAAINGMVALVGAGKDALTPVKDAFMSSFANVQKTLNEDDSTKDKDQLNGVMGDITDEQRDAINISKVEDSQLAEAEDNLDAIGYNYMPARYTHHHESHPNSVMFGSESYAREIPRLWHDVETLPYVIGDFTWTGYDYLGEAGIGAYHYDTDSDMGMWPDRLAYCGDIDLTGYRRPVSYLREIAYGLRNQPYITVSRVDKEGHPVVLNHWKYEDVVRSWTFPGYEGTNAHIQVLSAGNAVELLLNDKSLGKKETGLHTNYAAIFSVPYEPGTLKAISYDKDGKIIGTDELTTISPASKIQVSANNKALTTSDNDLLLLEIELTDQDGNLSMWDKADITVEVEGAGSLMGLGSADPQAQRSYQDNTCSTYDGRVLAAIRPNTQAGTIKVSIKAPNLDTVVMNIPVKNKD